jgi:hypothetical protein
MRWRLVSIYETDQTHRILTLKSRIKRRRAAVDMMRVG